MIKTSRKILTIMILISTALLWLPQPAQAAEPNRVIVGGNFTLEDGDSLNEDLVIIGGHVVLEDGSTLNGNILMAGGSLEAAGKVNGDISVAGGLLEIRATAIINGDVNAAGSGLQRDPDAIISGEITTEHDGPFIVTPAGVQLPQLNMAIAPPFSFFGFLLRVILWALMAMLLALFLPNQLHNISKTAVAQPLISGGLGLLTVVVLPLALLLIALTILLIPVSLVGLLLLVVAWTYGLIALGTELGNRFAQIFKSQWHPALAAGAGTFLLILVINGIEAAIPCLGLLPKVIVGAIGLGAVLLSRFGMQLYPPPAIEPIPEAATPVE
jgi:hypothetical protein